MNAEQNTVRGTVRQLLDGIALVEVEQGGCGRCHEKGGCGGQQLTQMFCSGPRHYRVANDDAEVRVGDRVTIAVPAGSIRQTANLAYILPLTAAIVGALIGMPLGGDPGAMIGALAGLVIAFLYVRHRAAQRIDDPAFRPRIVSHSS